jgi:hypothetical protein
MKVIEHIYAIKNLLNHGAVSDDYSYSNKLILHFLEITRAKLIEEKANKYHYISEQSFQSLCMDLEKGSFHNCCTGPEDLCLLKTRVQLPKTVTTRFGQFIKVMTLDGRVIPQDTITSYELSKYSITSKAPVIWFIHDNRIYIKGNINLVKVLVNGIFATPTEPTENCDASVDGICLDYLQQEFPIDSDLIDPMYKLTLNYLVLSQNKDDKNDTKDNTAISQPQSQLQ